MGVKINMKQIGRVYQIFNNHVAIACLAAALEREGFEIARSTSFTDAGEHNYWIGYTQSGKHNIVGKILGTQGRVHTESCPHLDEFLSRFDLEQTPYGYLGK